MINLDYQSRMPIYEQIVHEIEKYVSLEILILLFFKKTYSILLAKFI